MKKQVQGTVSAYMQKVGASMRKARPAPLTALQREARRTLNDALAAHEAMKATPLAATNSAAGLARYESAMDALEVTIAETRERIERDNGVNVDQREFTGGTVSC